MRTNLTKRLTAKSPYCVANKGVNDKINFWEYEKYGKVCVYCKVRVSFKNPQNSSNHATADHIYSRNDIRRALDKTIVLCCTKCNAERNDNETHGDRLLYNKMCFRYLHKIRKINYTRNGNCKINGLYPDEYFNSINLFELVFLASKN